MIFQGQVRAAVMSAVNQKISQAEADYNTRISQNKEDYKTDLEKAKQIQEQKDAVALEQAVQSVLKGLI